MKISCVVCLPALFAAAINAGCEAARAGRIRAHPEVYDALDPFSKKLVQEGYFDIGFTPEVVVMSLGKPDRVTKEKAADGDVETWAYKNYLYGNLGGASFGPRDNIPVTRTPSSRSNPSPSVPNAASNVPTPTIADMSGPPLATLLLEFRDGHVVGAKLQF